MIDGDTIDVAGERVRLFGIDAPELGQPCRIDGRTIDCGQWASRAVRDTFGGQLARCDDRGTDRYGRTIARCTVGGRDIGGEIVRAGFAEAFRRYSLDYVDEEKEAIVGKRGIWRTEMARPADFRNRAAQVAQSSGSARCVIKGNISDNGRIYHMPGQEHYDRTRISTSKGERWFCTEAEARAAGWRRARR